MSSVRAAPACVPTWRGHIETPKDALIIFEAALQGVLAHCIRRPHDRERNALIVSGNVFVYEEGTSGIKRWTDGIPWSPSRILTNFLIYRQLNSPFPPGEKKRATKRSQRPIRAGEPYAAPISTTNGHDDGYPLQNPSPTTSGLKTEELGDSQAERNLVGSLVDSYEFKDGGLLKKTMTVTVNGVQHHLVSYYSLDDAKYNLKTPREDPHLKDMPLREELTRQPKFKVTNLDDAGDGAYDQTDNPQSAYPYFKGNLPTVGSYSTPAHNPYSQPDQSAALYYSAYTPYTSHLHTPMHTPTSISTVGYSMPTTPTTYTPTTPSSYTPIASSSTAYPQFPHQTEHPLQQQQQQQHQNIPQPQRRSSNQTYVKSEPQSQYHTHVQQQPQYQATSQIPQMSYQEQKPNPQAIMQQSPSETTPRRDGLMNIFPHTHDALGISNSFYPPGVQSGNMSGSLNEAFNILPQPSSSSFYNGRSDTYALYQGSHAT